MLSTSSSVTSSFLRKLLSYGQTNRAQLHSTVYGFSSLRVLTVTRGRKRVDSILAANRSHAVRLCPPGVSLFADPGVLQRRDLLSYTWSNGTGNGHLLLQ